MRQHLHIICGHATAYHYRKELKQSSNENYTAMRSAASAQRVIQVLGKDWKSFFASIKDWKKISSQIQGAAKTSKKSSNFHKY